MHSTSGQISAAPLRDQGEQCNNVDQIEQCKACDCGREAVSGTDDADDQRAEAGNRPADIEEHVLRGGARRGRIKLARQRAVATSMPLTKKPITAPPISSAPAVVSCE